MEINMSREYQPGDFEAFMQDEHPLLSTMGKAELETIAGHFIRESIQEGKWVQVEIGFREYGNPKGIRGLPDGYARFAEIMVQEDFLKRIKPPTDSLDHDFGEPGIYEITQVALDHIMGNLNERKTQKTHSEN